MLKNKLKNIDMNAIQKSNLLNEAGLCEALGVCRATVYLWRKKKRIPFFKVGGQYRYSLEEVLAATRVSKN